MEVPHIEDFITHGVYLRGWSDKTLRTYRQGLATLADVPLTKIGLAAWMRSQQQRGLKPGGINMYARSANSFLTWANVEGSLTRRSGASSRFVRMGACKSAPGR